MKRFGQLLGVLAILSACAGDTDRIKEPATLGQFRLGHNIAIADNVQRGPFSRDITETKLEAAVQNAVAERLRPYDGDGLYHLGIVVGGLVLAQPGIPVVYAPQSVMIVDVTVFDNDTKEKLNETPKRITVGEGFQNIVPFVGSGFVRSADEQLDNLSKSLAREIEDWLKENPEWFAPRPGQVRIPYDIGVEAPRIQALSAPESGEAASGDN